jgi:alternate signal-mediated exported protein
MERMTKAALAVGGAAVLLLGGAGTLAYWTADGTASGTALTSGTFDLADGTCAAWEYSEADGGGAVTAIVPGDTVVTSCSFEVTATGDHIGIGAVTVSDPEWVESNALTTELGTATVESTTLNDVPFTAPVAARTGDVIEVGVEVTFDGPGATNASQNLTATLGSITVTIEQAHIAPA